MYTSLLADSGVLLAKAVQNEPLATLREAVAVHERLRGQLFLIDDVQAQPAHIWAEVQEIVGKHAI
jgi:hypothetical protein